MQKNIQKNYTIKLIILSILFSYLKSETCEVDNCKDCLNQKGLYCQICKKGYFLITFKNSTTGEKYNDCWLLWKAYIVLGAILFIIIIIGVMICRKLNRGNQIQKVEEEKVKQTEEEELNSKKGLEISNVILSKKTPEKDFENENEKKEIEDTDVFTFKEFGSSKLNNKILKNRNLSSTQMTNSLTNPFSSRIKIISRANPVAKVIFSARKVPPKIIRRYFYDDFIKERNQLDQNGNNFEIIEYENENFDTSGLRSLQRFNNALNPQIQLKRRFTSPNKDRVNNYCRNSPIESIQNFDPFNRDSFGKPVEKYQNEYIDFCRNSPITNHKFYEVDNDYGDYGVEEDSRKYFTTPKKRFFDIKNRFRYDNINPEIRSETKLFKDNRLENRVTIKGINFPSKRGNFTSVKKSRPQFIFLEDSKQFISNRKNSVINNKEKYPYKLKVSLEPETIRKKNKREETQRSRTLNLKEIEEMKKDLENERKRSIQLEPRDKLNRRMSSFRYRPKYLIRKNSLEFDSLNHSNNMLNQSNFLIKRSRSMLFDSRKYPMESSLIYRTSKVNCPFSSPGPVELNHPAIKLN